MYLSNLCIPIPITTTSFSEQLFIVEALEDARWTMLESQCTIDDACFNLLPNVDQRRPMDKVPRAERRKDFLFRQYLPLSMAY